MDDIRFYHGPTARESIENVEWPPIERFLRPPPVTNTEKTHNAFESNQLPVGEIADHESSNAGKKANGPDPKPQCSGTNPDDPMIIEDEDSDNRRMGRRADRASQDHQHGSGFLDPPLKGLARQDATQNLLTDGHVYNPAAKAEIGTPLCTLTPGSDRRLGDRTKTSSETSLDDALMLQQPTGTASERVETEVEALEEGDEHPTSPGSNISAPSLKADPSSHLSIDISEQAGEVASVAYDSQDGTMLGSLPKTVNESREELLASDSEDVDTEIDERKSGAEDEDNGLDMREDADEDSDTAIPLSLRRKRRSKAPRVQFRQTPLKASTGSPSSTGASLRAESEHQAYQDTMSTSSCDDFDRLDSPGPACLGKQKEVEKQANLSFSASAEEGVWVRLQLEKRGSRHFYVMAIPAEAMDASKPNIREHSRRRVQSRPPSHAQRKKYTLAEDSLLKHLRQKRCLSWNKVQKYFPTRTMGSLQVRYSTRLKGEIQRKDR